MERETYLYNSGGPWMGIVDATPPHLLSASLCRAPSSGLITAVGCERKLTELSVSSVEVIITVIHHTRNFDHFQLGCTSL